MTVAIAAGHGPDEPWSEGEGSQGAITRRVAKRIEYQFNILPVKSAATAKAFCRIGKIKATRGDFLAFIRNVGAFQLKRELLQRNFQMRFWLFEEITRRNPKNVNGFMRKLASLNSDDPEVDKTMKPWVDEQAPHYVRLLHYVEKAKTSPQIDQKAMRAAIESMAMHIKADFLKDLVMFGDMEPSREGLEKYAAGLSKKQKRKIDERYNDALDRVEEKGRRVLRIRWMRYRGDLMDSPGPKLYRDVIKELDTPVDSVVVEVGDHKITMGDFLAVHGPIQLKETWNSIKMSRLQQMKLSYLIGNEVDHLDLLPERYRDKIKIAELIYLVGEQIIREFGPSILEPEKGKIDFLYFRTILRTPHRQNLVELFLKESAKLEVYKNKWIDQAYLNSLNWRVSNTYSPP